MLLARPTRVSLPRTPAQARAQATRRLRHPRGMAGGRGRLRRLATAHRSRTRGGYTRPRPRGGRARHAMTGEARRARRAVKGAARRARRRTRPPPARQARPSAPRSQDPRLRRRSTIHLSTESTTTLGACTPSTHLIPRLTRDRIGAVTERETEYYARLVFEVTTVAGAVQERSWESRGRVPNKILSVCRRRASSPCLHARTSRNAR